MRRAFGTLMAAMMLAVLAGGSAMAATAPAGPPAPGGPSLPLCLGVDVLGLDLGQGSECASGVAPA